MKYCRKTTTLKSFLLFSSLLVIVILTNIKINKDYDRQIYIDDVLIEEDNLDPIEERGIINTPNQLETEIETRGFVNAEIGQISSELTPAGSVTKFSLNIEQGSVNMVDLSEYSQDYFAIKWGGDNLKYALSNTVDSIPELTTLSQNDDIGLDVDVSISELLMFDGDKVLFLRSQGETENIELHLISTEVNDAEGYNTQWDASGFTSGVGYTSLPMISREQWSDYSNINDPRLASEGGRLVWDPVYYNVNKIVVHHTYTTNGADAVATVRAIYTYHASTLGWGDIGYNYLIDHNGDIFQGKLGGDEAKGYHAGTSGNPNSIGIALLGDFTSTVPTSAAQDSLKKLIAEKAALYNFSPSWHLTVYGHRDFMATACPGQAFYNILPSITSSANSYKSTHFATIKNVVSKVNDGVSNGNYEQGKLYLLFYNNVSISTLAQMIPFYNNQPVDWTGITDFEINGKEVILTVDYTGDEDGSQLTTDRLRTLYKLFWLNGNVKAASLNFEYKMN